MTLANDFISFMNIQYIVHDFFIWIYNIMWWSSVFGNYRYKWLRDKIIISATTNENMDEICRQVFNATDLRPHSIQQRFIHIFSEIT